MSNKSYSFLDNVRFVRKRIRLDYEAHRAGRPERRAGEAWEGTDVEFDDSRNIIGLPTTIFAAVTCFRKSVYCMIKDHKSPRDPPSRKPLSGDFLVEIKPRQYLNRNNLIYL